MSEPLHLYDRSRTTTDWVCKRKRYLNYEYEGRGIVPQSTGLELFMGSALHDALAAIAIQHQSGSVDIDLIAATAKKAMFDSLSASTGDNEYEVLTFANEQAALVEGLLRGFHKHVWPRLIAQYPTIIAVEQEMTYAHNNLTFMARPDLVVGDAEGNNYYVEYKSTSSKREEWINSWGTAVQLHSTIRAIESTLGIQMTGVIIQGLYKGYCLTPETPVLTSDLRWVTVASLAVGDTIAGFDDERPEGPGHRLRQWKTAKVTGTGRVKLPCYKLTFEDGSTVTCSDQHKWLTAWRSEGTGAARWVTTENLVPYLDGYTKGHRVVKLVEPWDTHNIDISDFDRGYLAAAFDGEGNFSQHHVKAGWLTHLNFTQNDNEMLAAVRNILTRNGITFCSGESKSPLKTHRTTIYGKDQLIRFLGKVRPERLLPKFSFDKLGGTASCKRPVRLINKEFVGMQDVIALETSTGTLVANGFASHNTSYNKQNSPFCYAYKRNGNPPFTKDEISYDYKAGFKRYPTWELPGGVKAWVNGMSAEVLADQFPQTPPIFLKQDLIDRFFAQRAIREAEISMAHQMLAAVKTDADRQMILDGSFEQNFEACSPAYGRGCQYKILCHGHVPDPLSSGFQWRESHHEAEAKQHAEQELSSGN